MYTDRERTFPDQGRHRPDCLDISDGYRYGYRRISAADHVNVSLFAMTQEIRGVIQVIDIKGYFVEFRPDGIGIEDNNRGIYGHCLYGDIRKTNIRHVKNRCVTGR